MSKRPDPKRKGRKGPHPPVRKPSKCPICKKMIPDPPGLLVHLHDEHPDQ